MNYIDLFSGCGGLSLGLKNAGWRGLFAVEKNNDAFSTLKHNLIDNKKHFDWPNWLPVRNYDINYFIKRYNKDLKKLRGKVQLVAGGPPCQGFSTAGARSSKDKRNSLVHSYIKFISIIKPKLIFFENVKGFTFEFKVVNRKGRTYSDEVILGLQELGYNLEYKIINFSEYGVPQARSRFILIGKLREEVGSFFNKLEDIKNNLLIEKGICETISLLMLFLIYWNQMVRQAAQIVKISILVPIQKKLTSYQSLMRFGIDKTKVIPDSHRFANHSESIVNQFQLILKYGEGNKRLSNELKEKFKVKKRSITPLSPEPAVPGYTSHPDDYIHYKEPRILTVREYARIQSFPDWYEFKGKYTTGGKARKKRYPATPNLEMQYHHCLQNKLE